MLHLDHEGHYGSEWASFGVAELHSWLAAGDASSSEAVPAHTPDELPVAAAAAARSRLSHVSFAGPDASPGAPASALRGCTLDLAGPKLVFCCSSLVDALLRSGAHSCVEFKAVEAVALLNREGSCTALRCVPASRAEVFASQQLSPADKRALMRALKAAAEASGLQAPASDGCALPSALFSDAAEPFDSALRSAGLSAELSDALLYGLALLDSSEGVSVAEGLPRLRRFLASLGRYASAGALLVPLYGVSELPQAFCRAAVRSQSRFWHKLLTLVSPQAVSGATYVLRRAVESVLLHPSDESSPTCRRVRAVRTAGGQTVPCAHLAAGAAFWAHPRTVLSAPRRASRRTACAACILGGPLLEGKQNMLALVPPGSLGSCSPPFAVRCLQFGPSSCTCPEGRVLLLLSMRCPEGSEGDSARDLLWPALSALAAVDPDAPAGDALPQSKPALRWAVFYTQSCEEEAEGAHGWLPANAALCAGVGDDPDVDDSVRAAEAAMARLFPGVPLFSTEAAAAADAEDADEELEDALLQPPV